MYKKFAVVTDLTDFQDGAVYLPFFTKELKARNIMQAFLGADIGEQEVTLWFGQPLAGADVGDLSVVIAAHRASVPIVKGAMYTQVDRVTDIIIAQGFEFDGMRFSCSLEAQSRALGMDQLRNDPLFTYPVKWNNSDDTNRIELATADVVHAFVLTGIGFYRAAIDSGTTLKDAVRAATTLDDLSTIVDSRLG